LQQGDDVVEGQLNCGGCSRTYQILRSVARFVESDLYVKSFSAEWKQFWNTQLDNEQSHETREDFIGKTGTQPESLNGKCVLEAGCGMGRFCDIVSRVSGSKVVGFDLSTSVESAERNVGSRSNVSIVQADIMSLPFANETFDFVFSIGVLHHTKDPKQAFSKLVPTLKHGAKIAIWVYPKYNWVTFSDFYRHFTSHMPEWMLLPLVKLMIYINRIAKKAPKRVYKRLFKLMPVSIHSDYEHQLLDTFDWYSPKYQFKFDLDEVTKWFEQQGLQEIQSLPSHVSMTANKP
jgi:SAM-dependent methyltransferase